MVLSKFRTLILCSGLIEFQRFWVCGSFNWRSYWCFSVCFTYVFWYFKKNNLRWIWSNPQELDFVENDDFKKVEKRKESKGKVFKFVGFKTTWASKIIEKPLDQSKKRFSDVSCCLGCLAAFGILDEHNLEQTYALAAVLLMLARICSQKPKCSVCPKVKKPLCFIAFFDSKTEKEHPAAPRDRWEREILEKF